MKNFDCPWPLLSVVFDGISILDVPRLELKNIQQATEFAYAYGFDTTNAEDLSLLWGIFDSSIHFIEKALRDPRYPTIPEHLRTRAAVNDLRRLLLLASEDPKTSPDQKYACAILRVMHVLIHLAHDSRMKHFHEVQNQILSRLDNHLYTDAMGVTYLGKPDEQGIKLLFIKRKDKKDKEREVIKLLHKSDNLVEEIFDRIGFRLVTETKFDAFRAVLLLIEKNIISVPNLRPGRSRNRLIDFERLKFEVERVNTHIQKSGPEASYVTKLIKRIEKRIGFSRLGRSLINPHSSEYYKAIQFTCRELVRVSNTQFLLYEKLRKHLEKDPEKDSFLKQAFPEIPKPHEYTFFPYEIQIMDVKSYADSIFGKSNHDEYRKKQLDAARTRVFGAE